MPRVTAVVLAAGRSVRFNGNKLVAELRGRALLRVVVESVMATVDDVVVVLGHEAERVATVLHGLPVRVVSNPDYEQGMGTSVAVGIGALRDDMAAALVALGDQPVRSEIVIELIDSYRRHGHAIIAPLYNGVRGNPVIFDRKLFGELMALDGDRGARDLIERHRELLVTIPFDCAAPLDVDTQADFQTLLRKM